jgi:hypothetical protein
MKAMTTRRPQRTRRRTAPAASLPRPAAEAASASQTSRSALRPSRHRAHHVTTDYHYVRKDLLTILGVGTACLVFIFGMAFYIGAL